jgi:VWFA-related protein
MRWFGLLILTVLAFAQEDAVFHATTQLVPIDVVAEDKDGKPVPGLTKDDFELFVNGKRQEIATFSGETVEPPAPVTLPRGTFSNRQAAMEVRQGRYTVFLLDWKNTNWALMSFAHQQLLKTLSQLPAGSKVALYLNNNGLQIVQEFTSDHELIKEKAAGLFGNIPPPPFGLDGAELAADQTVAAFQAVAKHLAGISGQKVLIWISTGFPDNAPASDSGPAGQQLPPGFKPSVGGERVGVVRSNAAPAPEFLQDIDKAVWALGNANIVLESVESTYLGATVSPVFGPRVSYVNPLMMIAERTGGKFYPGDNNDMAGTLRDAANDRATSYQLGYYAADDLRPGLQPFEIKCKRPGVRLRYREGYYVEKKPPVVQTDVRATTQDLLEAAVDAVAIPLTATVQRTMGNVGGVVVVLNIDANAITLKQEGDHWIGKISVFARFAGDEDEQYGDVPMDAPALTLTQAQHDKFLRDGLPRRFTMKVPDGASTLRVLVRDDNSGSTGSVTIPVDDLPEF